MRSLEITSPQKSLTQKDNKKVEMKKEKSKEDNKSIDQSKRMDVESAKPSESKLNIGKIQPLETLSQALKKIEAAKPKKQASEPGI